MKKLFLLIILMVSCSGCALLLATPPGFYDSRGNYSGCSYPCYIGNDGRYHYDVDIDDHD
jgi:hypothetical protein